jgi:hypothetical protein
LYFHQGNAHRADAAWARSARTARRLAVDSERAVWSGVHGHTTLELTGFFDSVGRDPVRSYSEILTRMSIGLGDHALIYQSYDLYTGHMTDLA